MEDVSRSDVVSFFSLKMETISSILAFLLAELPIAVDVYGCQIVLAENVSHSCYVSTTCLPLALVQHSLGKLWLEAVWFERVREKIHSIGTDSG